MGHRMIYMLTLIGMIAIGLLMAVEQKINLRAQEGYDPTAVPSPTADMEQPPAGVEAVLTGTPIYLGPVIPPDVLNPISIDPTDTNIVYLIAEGTVSEDSPLSPNGTLSENTQAQIATSMDEVIAIDAQQAVDVLVVHKSAYEIARHEWTAAAFRDGMPIMLVNMYFAELAEIVDSDCGRQQALEVVNPFEGLDYDYYYANATLILSETPELEAQARESMFQTCEGSRYGAQADSRVTHGTLVSDMDFVAFTNTAVDYASMMKTARTNFQNRHLPPTAVPELP